MKKTIDDIIFQWVNVILIAAVVLVMVYPIYFTVIASLSDPNAVGSGQVTFWVKGFTLDPYRNVFAYKAIWTGYRNSIVYTALGTAFSLALTIPAAYALSKKKLPGRSFLSWFFLFTMYFSGGMIPTYLLVRSLNLLNKPYTLIVLGGVGIFNMIVARIYFSTAIPEEIFESARIDGASDFRQFFMLALPLALPIVAVVTLYFAVGRWNDYYSALIYISKNDYMPLQMVLREILVQNQMVKQVLSTGQNLKDKQVEELMRRLYMAEGMKYAIIFIASAPMLAAYPFVQKHFIKGIFIGSLKG